MKFRSSGCVTTTSRLPLNVGLKLENVLLVVCRPLSNATVASVPHGNSFAMFVVNPKLSEVIVVSPPDRKLLGGWSWLWVKTPAPKRGM